jgi:lambda family phage portal protein
MADSPWWARRSADAFVPGGKTPNAYPAAASQTSRRGKSWSRASGGPNRVAEGSFTQLRQQSRRVLRINPLAFSAKATLVSNAVGTGIKPLFATPDSGFNKAAAELWDRWTAEADADGLVDFYGQQALVFGGMFEAGETFTRIRQRRPGDVATVPLQLQVVEPEFVPIEKTELSARGGEIRCGIEFDAIGRRTAYWMYRYHPDDQSGLAMSNVLPVPVPASEVLHVYDAVFRRPGLIRGEPWLSRVIVALDDLDDYQDAERLRKKVAALYAGFLRRPVPDGLTDDGLKEFFGQDAEIDDDLVGTPTLEPATMQVLGPGEDITFSEPADVGQSYEPFLRAQHRSIAVGMGMMYEQLIGDYSTVNDRTYRAAVGEFRRLVEMWQHLTLVHQWCAPIHRRWLAVAFTSGALARPAGMTDADLYRVRWITPKWTYLNPVQDVAAEEAEVRAGFRSRSDVVAARGYDVEDVDAEIERDQSRADELGLVFTTDARKTADAGTSPTAFAPTSGDPSADIGPGSEPAPQPDQTGGPTP